MFCFLAVVMIVIIAIICALASHKNSQSSVPTYTSQSYDYSSSPTTSNRKPKISAEIDEDFYDSVQSYCRNKSISISELIRRSVKSYMEDN